MYPDTTKETAGGNPLTGDNKYVLRFSKDQMPPAKQLLVAHDVRQGRLPGREPNQAALDQRPQQGQAWRRRFADDLPTGGLTQQGQGGQPVPCQKEGQFKLYLRIYGLTTEVLGGNWTHPAVERIK